MTKVLFPGTFDPITKGHVDLIQRACELFDEVYVVCMENNEKSTLLDLNERISCMKESLTNCMNVHIDSYQGLSVKYAKEHDISIIIRGIRSFVDYEYELQVAEVNKHLANIETVFLPSNPSLSFISSSTVKAVAVQHGDLDEFVTPYVKQLLVKHYHK